MKSRNLVLLFGEMALLLFIAPVFLTRHIASYFLLFCAPLGFLFGIFVMIKMKFFLFSRNQFLALVGIWLVFVLFVGLLLIELVPMGESELSCSVFNNSSLLLNKFGYGAPYADCGNPPSNSL